MADEPRTKTSVIGDRGRVPDSLSRIPDHELLRRIGGGAYGEVWLAKNVMGTYRAVKIVYRNKFENDLPYEREFSGIKKFEPVSRGHPGLVNILHIGRNDAAGYYYYIMEVGDDRDSGQEINPETYDAKTLGTELLRRKKLPPEECLEIALALTAALEYLHRQGLIHRDIKPANIIFLNGRPKIADIGLVTNICEKASFVGTEGYMSPEGPGSPTADIYSMGKVLYELSMGLPCRDYPALPTTLAEHSRTGLWSQLNEVILKACDQNSRHRYQSAQEMHAALFRLHAEGQRALGPVLPTKAFGNASLGASRVTIFYKSSSPTDVQLLRMLAEHLGDRGCEVFYDKHLAIGVEWAREIEKRIRESDAAIVLLSASSIHSEMLAYEVEIASQAAQQQGKPLLLPIRVRFAEALPGPLASLLNPLHYFLWEEPRDNERLVGELLRALAPSPEPAPPAARSKLESVGGAVPLDSRFYVLRPTDQEFQTAITRRDSIVLVKGARQMGKTSLLARGLEQARQSGAKVVLTDFQKLNARHLESVESFFLTLGDFLADQLNLEVLPEEAWDKRRSPNTNFERYLRREVMGKIPGHFVWGLDEVDRLFTCDFGSEVFGLFRSWHNERALDPSGPWSRLTLAIAYATEAHLFITDVNQSPFNVGTRLTLDDFNFDQVADLNQRHGSPLRDDAEVRRFFALVGGQPYLVRRGLAEMTSGHVPFPEFAQAADRDEGIFGDHLRRILVLLAKDQELAEVVRGILRGQPCPDAKSFYRLRSAGVMAGDSPQEVRPRCEIYATYLKQHLS